MKKPIAYDSGDLSKIDQPSRDNRAMREYWEMVDHIIKGVRAMRSAKETYLPRMPNETKKDYDFRLKCSTMTNVYTDVVTSLANKPFSEEAYIIEGTASNDIMELGENIDGSGNHLSIVLGSVFFRGINEAVTWILVEFPNTNGQLRTRAEEKALNIRPYWVNIPARNMLEVRSNYRGRDEKITYARWIEPGNSPESDIVIEYVTLAENSVVRREYDKDEKGNWQKRGDDIAITIGVIPLVPFITGMRIGKSWQFEPALRDAADLQIELFQSETDLKHAKRLTCFPMLAANGVAPDRGPDGKPLPVPMGPNAVLFAPPNDDGTAGSWERIAADAASLKFLSDENDKLINRIRELGKQPLTAQSHNVTRISSGFAAQKANSAAQSWALALKDSAEQAFMFTAKWMNDASEPEVFIFTDFNVDFEDNESHKTILEMRKNGDISRDTLWNEMKRRGILANTFDPKKESEAIAVDLLNDPIENELTNPERTEDDD